LAILMEREDGRLMVIVDADTLAGWRRATSSLAQLREAVAALRTQAPDAVVAVIADASLKWALSDAERDQIETDIVTGQIVFAPAGCVGGHVGFIGRIVEKASTKGMSVVALTDQAVGDTPLAKVRKDRAGAWVFDLEGATASTQTAVHHQRRRRRAQA
jgi:hypothetical protein